MNKEQEDITDWCAEMIVNMAKHKGKTAIEFMDELQKRIELVMGKDTNNEQS